jgi:inorganic pyrophosphatase
MEKAFLDSLSDSFYVSTTVKTYNTYLNDTGFIGGSLGGDLDTQLARIADLFSLAGMPIKDDLKWLRSAILNCSPLSVVGEKNKNLIEDYLGSVAALALFDEGGAEAKIVSAMLKQTQDSVKKISTTANILHLYRTNTLYVPGSYVL